MSDERVGLAPWRDAGHFRRAEDVLLYVGPGNWMPGTPEADDRAFGFDLAGPTGDYVRHARGCPACTADLDQQAAAADDEVDEELQGYSTAARERLDALLADEALVLVDPAGRPCGDGDRYLLSPDAPLPGWLHEVLLTARVDLLDVDFPEFAYCTGALDWPTLLAAHPDEIVVDENTLALNGAAPWSGIAAAYAHLRERDHHPELGAVLGVSRDNRITLLPNALWPGRPLPETDPAVRRVDDILTAAGGAPGRFCEGTPQARGWMLC